MKYAHMRPRIDKVVSCSPNEVKALIKARLDMAQGCPYEGQMGGSHVSLMICKRDRAFWSPWLDCHVEAYEGGARVYGRLTPHPSIWTGFMAGYAFLIFLGLIGAVYGYTQWVMGQAPWALLLVPLALLLSVILYLSSLVGQLLSQEQMTQLRAFLDEALEGV